MEETLKKISDKLPICDNSKCVADDDSDVLQCDRCQRNVHYRCSMLPAYQIQLFLQKTTRKNKFVCINCVQVDERILELVPIKQRSQPSLKREQELESLRREVDACNGLLKQYEKDKTLADAMNEEFLKLKISLKNDPGLHTLEFMEQKFEDKLVTIKEDIEMNLGRIVKEELKSISERSYAAVTELNTGTKRNQPKSIKEAIKEAWREEEAEENDKVRRSRNIIVHGVSEQDKTKDAAWAEDLVKDTHTLVNIKSISRLGKATDGKKRPMLVSLANENQKASFLGNLPALKGIGKYDGVSVTEDLTPGERKQLRELSVEAKARNTKEDPDVGIWRVRGNSKNGFYLKKLPSKLNKTDHTSKKVTFAAHVQTRQ